MQNYVYRLPEKSAKNDFIFNVFGSLMNAAASVILLVVVSYVSGETIAGIFSLAYSTAQMMYTFSVFEMRNIQVTDAKGEYPFEYIGMFRFVTTGSMWIFLAVFCAIEGYKGEKLMAILLLTLYMSLLSISDLFQGNLHLQGYLGLAGKSLACQVFIASVVFAATLFFTNKLWLAITLMTISVAVWIVLYDIPYNNNFNKAKFKFDKSKILSMYLCAFPLFLSSFLHQYIFNSPKYAIDEVLTDVEQSHYGYLVMPVFCINLLSLFVLRPQLVSMSKNWLYGKYKQFIKTTIFFYLWIMVVAFAVIIGGYLLGIPILEWLYKADLSGERLTFMILLAAGTLGAYCSITSTLITVMRKQKYCLIAYCITFFASLFLPKYFVSKFGLQGAAWSYLIEMAILFITMLAIFIFTLTYSVKKRGKE